MKTLSLADQFWYIIIVALTLAAETSFSEVSSSFSQERTYQIRNWDRKDGLPGSRVCDVARTPDGYLWIATLDGLARFDGKRFTMFDDKNTPAIEDIHISSLLVAHDGTLWVGTFSGTLAKRVGTTFSKVNLGKTESNDTILHLSEDTTGAIWIGTKEGRMIKLRSGQVEIFGPESGLPAAPIRQILCDEQGYLWAVTDNRLWNFKSGRWIASDLPLNQGAVTAIARCSDGGIWVGISGSISYKDTGGQLFKLKDAKWIPDQWADSYNRTSHQSRPELLVEDKGGRLWCATSSGILFRESDGEWKQLAQDNTFSNLLINCLEADSDGAIWVGTDASGLYQIYPRLVSILTPPTGGTRNIFWTVCAREDGSIWGGTDGSGIYRWDNGTMKQYGRDQGLMDQRVTSLIEDRSDQLLAGTLGGLYRLNGNAFEQVPGPPELQSQIFALFEDRSGNTWVGTDCGLVRMKDGEYTVFNSADGLPNALTTEEERNRDRTRFSFDNTRIVPAGICAVEEDFEGRIWVVVAGQGLFIKKGNTFEHVILDGWEGESRIRAIHADKSGNLWIATYGYWFLRLKEGKITIYAFKEATPSGHIIGMLEDREGRLWFSSDYGIYGCSKRVLDEYDPEKDLFPNWWWLSKEDGLANKVCSGIGQPAATMGKDGSLWFANGDALASFHPSSVIETLNSIPARIEEALVDGVPQEFTPDGELRIKGIGRQLEIHYTAANTTKTDRFRFWHKMEGIDDGWIEMDRRDVQKQRSSNYVLPAGEFEFRVMTSDPNGEWKEAPSRLKIDVTPLFWERRSVKVGSILLLLLFVAGTVWQVERSRSRRNSIRLELLNAMAEERQRIARDIHDDLGSGLTEIIMEADHLEQDFPHTAEGRQQSQLIAIRARSLTKAMDEVVWAINPKHDTLESLITYLNTFAQGYLMRVGARCRCDFPKEHYDDLHLSANIRHNLYLAAKEAIHNTIKHASASEVWIRWFLNETRTGFILSIEDDGKGFDTSLSHIRGNGLQNMAQRLIQVGGKCEIHSTPGQGTKVQFIIEL